MCTDHQLRCQRQWSEYFACCACTRQFGSLRTCEIRQGTPNSSPDACLPFRVEGQFQGRLCCRMSSQQYCMVLEVELCEVAVGKRNEQLIIPTALHYRYDEPGIKFKKCV